MKDKKQDEFEKLLRETPIHFDLSDRWRKAAKYALKHASPLSLGITGREYRDLVTTQDISAWQFAILNSNLENCTPYQLDELPGAYSEIVVECQDFAKLWNDVYVPMQVELHSQGQHNNMKVVN